MKSKITNQHDALPQDMFEGVDPKEWNTSSSWDTELPTVSPCFRHTALVWLPCSAAWLLALCEAWTLGHRDSSHTIPCSGLYVTKLVFQVLTFIVCTAKLVVSSLLYLHHEADLAEVAGASVVLCTLVLVTSLTMWERWKGLQSSVVIPTFWLVFAICTAITCYADVVDFNYDLQNPGVFCSFSLLPLTVVQLVLSSLSEKPSPYAPLDTQAGLALATKVPHTKKGSLPGGRVGSPGRTGRGSTMGQPATLEVCRTGAARNACGVAALLAQQPPQRSQGLPDCALAGTAVRDDRQPGQQRKPE
ncbi:hypothetical protein HPB49_005864 [Dermacentor silvarum]|uniref:Uncharacterized protein n=1 Tax=Dermacentor silvarum TaxID=543639 RepID=A0ACB8CVH1_DERSI|nr:hypothetical protein HPB49_005864 [Dermacentor silvarum]